MNPPMIPMRIRSVELDFARTLPCLVLEETTGARRKIAIFIEYDFVDHIAEALKQPPPKPEGMVKAWLEAVSLLDGEIVSCSIVDYDGASYQATITLRRHDGQILPVRTSPGCALAVSLYGGFPVSVREDLIEAARTCKLCAAHLDEVLNELDDASLDALRGTQTGKYKM